MVGRTKKKYTFRAKKERNMYKVKYTDSTGNNDSIQDYLTKKEAIEAIDSELHNINKYFKYKNYHYI